MSVPYWPASRTTNMSTTAGFDPQRGHDQLRGGRAGTSGASSSVVDRSMPRSLSTTDPDQSLSGTSLAWNDGLWGNSSSSRGALMGAAGADLHRGKAQVDQGHTSFQAPTGSGSLLLSSEKDDGQRTGKSNYIWQTRGTPSPGVPQPQSYSGLPPVTRASNNNNNINNNNLFSNVTQPTLPALLGGQSAPRFSSRSSAIGSGSAGSNTPVSGTTYSSLQSGPVGLSARPGTSRLSGDAPPFRSSHTPSTSVGHSSAAGTSLSSVFGGLGLNMPPVNPSAPDFTPFRSPATENPLGNDPRSHFRPQFASLSNGTERQQPGIPSTSSFLATTRSPVQDDLPLHVRYLAGCKSANHSGPFQVNSTSMNAFAHAEYQSSTVPSSQSVAGPSWAANANGQQLPAYQDHHSIRQESPRSPYSWAASDFDSIAGVGLGSPERIPELPFMDQLPSFRPARASNRGSRSQSGSSQRPSMQSSYHSMVGTPSMESERFRLPFRGSTAASSYHPDDHSMLLDQRLRGLQRDQQAFPSPPVHGRIPGIGPYRGPPVMNPYAYLPPGPLGTGAGMPFISSLGTWSNPVPPRSTPQDRRSGTRLGSPLLEEFKSTSKTGRRFELRDIYDHMVEFCGDQAGSRFLQHKLETANSDEKERVFTEIRPNVLQLMMDSFGNYVIQKLFEHGTQQQKAMLAEQIKGHMLKLSVHPYACRVIQTVLDHVLVDQQADLIKELEPSVLRCVRDQHGNHVVQKAVEVIPLEHIRFIIDAFVGQVQNLATHAYGCRVIQRILEHCGEEGQAKILRELFVAGPALIQDQYGNYVAQHVIKHGKEEDRAALIGRVKEQLVQYSRHKFASNVVEKSIEYGTDEQRREFLTILTTLSPEGISPLQSLVEDQYGNYVIQKLLNKTEGAEHDRLVAEVRPHLVLMKRQKSGKQIIALEKLLQNSSITGSEEETVASPSNLEQQQPPSSVAPAPNAYPPENDLTPQTLSAADDHSSVAPDLQPHGPLPLPPNPTH